MRWTEHGESADTSLSEELGGDQTRIEAAAKAQLEERQANQLRERMAACTRVIYSEAQGRADSILRIESKEAKLDSITVPHDTMRPARPELDFPEYSAPRRDSTGRRQGAKK